MADEKKGTLEPTTENMTKVAKGLYNVQERVQEVADRSESEIKETREQLTAEIKKVSAEANAIAQRQTLGRLANDYRMEGVPLLERAMSDPGPTARRMKGEILNQLDSRIVEWQDLCDTMVRFCEKKGVPFPLNEDNVKRTMCDDSDAGRRAWERFVQMRVDFGATDSEFASSAWVPTTASPELINRYNLELKVAALFRQETMPSSTFTFPVMWARGSMATAAVGEVKDDSARHTSTLGTGLSMTLTAKKHLISTPVSDEANWDSIVPLANAIRIDHTDFLAYCVEYTIVNGDTTATHQDTDIEAAGAAHAAVHWKGLRKLAIAGSCKKDVNTDPWTTSVIRGGRKNMGVYGHIPSQGALLVSPGGYIDLLSNSDVKTYDVFGPAATVLQGQLANFDGYPVICTEAMRDDIGATGVNEASANTFTAWMWVNRGGFRVGNRLAIETKYSDVALMMYGASVFVSQKRTAFSPVWTPSTTYSTVWYGYNIA